MPGEGRIMVIHLIDHNRSQHVIETSNPELIKEWFGEYLQYIAESSIEYHHEWGIRIYPSNDEEAKSIKAHHWNDKYSMNGQGYQMLADMFQAIAENIDPMLWDANQDSNRIGAKIKRQEKRNLIRNVLLRHADANAMIRICRNGRQIRTRQRRNSIRARKRDSRSNG